MDLIHSMNFICLCFNFLSIHHECQYIVEKDNNPKNPTFGPNPDRIPTICNRPYIPLKYKFLTSIIDISYFVLIGS
jgi:hypothetical protein